MNYWLRLMTVFSIFTMFMSCEKTEEATSVTDIDGNVYETIQIGDQEWMAENLKVTHYRDGTAILTEGYWLYNVDTYGALYSWQAALDSRNIAPEGWHLPTDADWKELEMALGMSQSDANSSGNRGTNEGSKLAGSAALWIDGALENESEFGSSGFAALPGGYADYMNGGTVNRTFGAYFWSATEIGSDDAGFRGLTSTNTDIFRGEFDKGVGLSVRCLKD